MVVIEVVKVVLVVVEVAAGWQELTKKFASDACFLIYDNCIVFVQFQICYKDIV